MKNLTAETIAAFLNEALALDCAAISGLVFQRVPCNAALADHSTIQVGTLLDGGFDLGLLGLLNGMCDGERLVAAVIQTEELRVENFVAVHRRALVQGQPAATPAASREES